MRDLSISLGSRLAFCTWLLATGPLQGTEGGCGDGVVHKCCPGRNNDCSDVSLRKTPCYCDSYCEKTGDCCEDYHTVCQISVAVDCVVGPWGAWSECSSLCGPGSKERTCQVTVPPRNGGAPCPDLRQRRGCLGDNPVCETAKEVAKILPDSFKRDFKDPWRRPYTLLMEKLPRETEPNEARAAQTEPFVHDASSLLMFFWYFSPAAVFSHRVVPAEEASGLIRVESKQSFGTERLACWRYWDTTKRLLDVTVRALLADPAARSLNRWRTKAPFLGFGSEAGRKKPI
ncbi:hypothetical protein JRQ81_007709 [Phrynocephalus forsythii]|uniref:SMB domain-containing protein n=1 Tax=Phrynocephalus forsythii TaxID=171643 RepID=A0A9Q1ATA9_9SAUR|nr:hypothetical protein JRQ81_007709 [Phrynocephalus forsythii]